MWLEKLSLPIPAFAKDIVSKTFENRKNAACHFRSPKFSSPIKLKFVDSKITCTIDKNADYLSDTIWSESKINILSYSKESDNTYKKQNESEALINNQLSDALQFNVQLVPHNTESLRRFDAGTMNFLNATIFKNGSNKNWLEIRISDFKNFMQSKSEQQIYEEIQTSVFRELDDDTVVKLNQSQDLNLFRLKTSSETITDVPYTLGVFNSQTMNEETYSDKIENIRLALNESSTIPEEDISKLKNSLSVMSLLARGADQRTSSIHQVIKWASGVKAGLDQRRLYNSISGSSFISDLTDIGIKEKLMPTLYDLLYYTVDAENWYVPNFKPFTPFFLYTGGDKAFQLYQRLHDNPSYIPDGEEIAFLHNRISPQSGMYYVDQMTEKVSADGMWTQSWRGRKYDQGYLSLIYSELFKSEEKKIQKSKVFKVIEPSDNVFMTSYSMSPFLFQSGYLDPIYINEKCDFPKNNSLKYYLMKSFSSFPPTRESELASWINSVNGLLWHKSLFDNNDIDLKDTFWLDGYRLVHLHNMLAFIYLLNTETTVPSIDNTNYFSCNSFIANSLIPVDSLTKLTKQSLWPLNSDLAPSTKGINNFMTSNTVTKPYFLKESFQEGWFDAYITRFYTYGPELLRMANLKTWGTMQLYSDGSSNYYNYIHYWSTFNNAHYNGTTRLNILKEMYGEEDSYIPPTEGVSNGVVLESIEDFRNAVNQNRVHLDIGTVISVQKYDHPSVSPEVLAPDFLTNDPIISGKTELNKDILMSYDDIQFGEKTYAKTTISIPFTYSLQDDIATAFDQYEVRWEAQQNATNGYLVKYRNRLNGDIRTFAVKSGTVHVEKILTNRSSSNALGIMSRDYVPYDVSYSSTQVAESKPRIPLYNWRTVEKYLILDSSYIYKTVNDMLINQDYTRINQYTTTVDGKEVSKTLEFADWSDYIDASLRPDDLRYNTLQEFGLAFGQRLYDKSADDYLKIKIYQYAWSFLTNYWDSYSDKTLGITEYQGKYTASFVTRSIPNRNASDLGGIPKYLDEYAVFSNIEEYLAAISYVKDLDSEVSLEDLYYDTVIKQINGELLKDSMTATLTNEDKAKEFLESKRDKLKKDFAVKILTTDLLPKFFDAWLEIISGQIEESKLSSNWTVAQSPIPLDFVILTARDKFDATNFSAIKWSYDGSENPYDPIFGGSFVLNMSLNQLTFLQNRFENRMLEIVGVQDNKDYKTVNIQSSAKNKIFMKTSDIELYNQSISADKTYTYYVTRNDNEPADLSSIQRKYGRIRWIVNDKYSIASFLNSEKTAVDENKIQQQLDWYRDMRDGGLRNG
jgi:DNA-binding protein Fis